METWLQGLALFTATLGAVAAAWRAGGFVLNRIFALRDLHGRLERAAEIVEAEFTHNGGLSVKDVVHKLDRRLDGFEGRLDRLEAAAERSSP